MKRKNSKTKIYKGGSRVRPNRGGVAQNARLDRGSVAHFTRLSHDQSHILCDSTTIGSRVAASLV